MMQIKFTVPGEPQGKARPRFTRGGRAYTPKKTVEYESSIRRAFQAAGGKPTGNPVSVAIIAEYKIPKSASKAKRGQMLSGEILPTKKPDADNIAKAVCDALNGVAYEDDAQVCWLKVSKKYSDDPKIEVTVREVIP
jgi:Holliday junction resolvase RusA-like endonuclease